MKDLLKILSIIAAFGMFSIISACNTIHGVGQDLTVGGHAIQNAVS